MTIKYQSGRRIQGLSTDSPSATFSDDFSSSPNGWTLGSGHSIESGYLYADGDNIHSSKPFAIGSPSNFTFDFDYAPVDGSPRITYIILNSENTGYGAASSGNKKIVFLLTQNGMSMDHRYYISGASEQENHGGQISINRAPTDGTVSYYRMIKEGHNITLKRYASDANRTSNTSVLQTSIMDDLNVAGYNATADLAYLVVGGYGTYGGYSRNAKLHDFKFYIPSKPANVQVGSRFEETDTRKIFNFGGAGTIALDGTPQSNSGTTATSLSKSITVGNHSNKALIALVTQQSGSTTSVKVGSNSFTNMIKTNGAASGTGSQRTEIWYLLDGDITNNASNQVDWVGSAGSRVSIGVYSLYNVNQGGGADTFVASEAYNTSSSYSNQPNGVVNSVDTGDFILDVLSANSSTQPTDTLTEGYNVLISTNRYAVSQYNASPSTNNDMFYSNIVAAEWAWSGARIKQSTDAWSEVVT